MANYLSKEEIQRRVKAIAAIYQKYLIRFNEFKKQQTEIINQFIKELEQRKIKEIKKILK